MKNENSYKKFESKRYSAAFKEKVLGEIRIGKYSKSEASRLYGMSTTCIRKWIKRGNYLDLQDEIIHIKMTTEKDKLKELEREIKRLKEALADQHIENVALKAVIEAAEEHYKTDLKKNLDSKRSKK